MPVKTITTWNAMITEAERDISNAELAIRRAAGKITTEAVFSADVGIVDGKPTVAPYTTTREWATEADAQDWSAWVDEHISTDHSTKIV